MDSRPEAPPETRGQALARAFGPLFAVGLMLSLVFLFVVNGISLGICDPQSVPPPFYEDCDAIQPATFYVPVGVGLLGIAWAVIRPRQARLALALGFLGEVASGMIMLEILDATTNA